ncbi:MAG: FAD-binding oxidoreductase [Gemmatimonadota bacterium]|nr:FAD-binding oxidoreductase [Gemmatimonadota bacterium]
MKPGAQRPLTAWGRSSRSVSRLWIVETEGDALTAMRAAGARGIIARGYARSYGDVCLNDRGDVLDVTRFAAIRSFDRATGTLVCDAGTSYRDIMRHCSPLGWQIQVCPGTAFVSMGGAVANDVHGKNQHAAGSFGDHVDWIDLRLPDGSVRRVSRETDADLYAATVGGIGLTGVIQSLQLRLQRVPSNAMELREIRVADLDAFLDLLQSSESKWPYVVGWLDALTSGRHMGRGVLELARHSSQPVREPLPLSVGVPFEFPTFVLNRHTVRAFNAAYFRHVPAGGRERRIHVEKFLFPLDAIHNWNRMYGRDGVFQFQCVVPFADGRRAIVELMEEIVRSRGASFLAVLKSMGRSGQGMLSFPMPGFTLALDFPRRRETRPLILRLHEIVLKYDGRIYLAKDACLSAKQFEAMYLEADRFKAVLRRVDPNGRMQSDMSRRLGLSAGG